MTTKIQLRNKISEKIGIKGQGMTVSTDDARVIDEAIEDELVYLEYKANIDFTSADMPEEIIFSLRDRIAFRIADQFPPSQVSEGEFVDGLLEIRTFMRDAKSGVPIKANYF